MSESFAIVKEHPDLLKYIDKLQRANAESLAFYPLSAFEREAAKGRLFLGLLNGEPCGYLYVGAPAIEMRCHQVCIQYDARRKLYGAALAVAMEDHATSTGCRALRLRCGFDLDANQFWREMGYSCIAVSDGGVRRMRRINTWRKAVAPELFAPIGREPEQGKTSASTWAKHRTTGIVTQFNRGASLQAYRAEIIAAAKEAT